MHESTLAVLMTPFLSLPVHGLRQPPVCLNLITLLALSLLLALRSHTCPCTHFLLFMFTITSFAVTDFGFAKRVSDISACDEACGTPQYVAPEIIQGCSYDTKIDLWSAGVVAYSLLGKLYSRPLTCDNRSSSMRVRVRMACLYSWHTCDLCPIYTISHTSS